MQNYKLKLQSIPQKSYYTQLAANSLDINIEDKLTHEININADVTTDFNIGLIMGNSGSGKTTLCQHIYGKNCFNFKFDKEKNILDQMEGSYSERQRVLTGVGLSSVPCWLRPMKTLSNGQKFRAEVALRISRARDSDSPIIDEWTSVVDRTVAKIISHCIQKFARREKRKVILCCCHEDVEQWLNPDWVINCNTQNFFDYRGRLRRRSEKLKFVVRQCSRESWRPFSKYHYLSPKLPAGRLMSFGLFCDGQQVGFCCVNNLIPPRRAGAKLNFHVGRVVIHPDYQGGGLAQRFINESCELFRQRDPRAAKIFIKFSNKALLVGITRNKSWRFVKSETIAKMGDTNPSPTTNIRRRRRQVKIYLFAYLPKKGP